MNNIDYINLPENYIRENHIDLHWTNISIYSNLSDNFIREFNNKLDWYELSKRILSEDIIREFQDNVYWRFVRKLHPRSESFIIEFQDKMDWDEISFKQKLSNEFIIENITKLNINYLLLNARIIDPDIREYLMLLSGN